MSDNFFKIAKGVTLKSQSAAPANPQNGDMYYDSTFNKFRKYENGTWGDFGSGAGGINYLQSVSNGDSTTGFVTYDDGIVSLPIDGIGGTASTISVAASSSSPLRGINSLVLTKTAANGQGEGISYDFTIDAADKAKMLQFSIDYNIASGTYAADDLIVYIYDVTNAVLIQPVPFKIKNHTLASERFTFEFQTASNSISYRLIFHVASVSALAYSLKFDNLSLGPNSRGVGSVVTDWVEYTPTGGFNNATYSGLWRQVGGDIEVKILVALTGSPTPNTFAVTLPSGKVIDTTKLTNGANNRTPLGMANIFDNGTASFTTTVHYFSTTEVFVSALESSSTYARRSTTTETVPMTFISGDNIEIEFKVPIVGLSASSQIIDDGYVGRQENFSGALSGTQSIPNATITKIQLDSISSDSFGAWDSGNYRYVAKRRGKLKILGSVGFDSNAVGVRSVTYRVNGVGDIYLIKMFSVGASSIVLSISGETSNLNAGDYIEFFVYQDSTAALNILNLTTIQLAGQSGSPQVLASESVNARYTSASGQVVTTGNTTIIDFATKSYDTHNSVTTGASWKYTSPIAQKVAVSSIIIFGGASGGDYIYLLLYKNNTLYSKGLSTAPINASFQGLYFYDEIELNAGDYIDIRAFNNTGGNRSLTVTASDNHITISKVG